MTEKGAITSAVENHEGSLVPLIETEERHLAEMVEAARGMAEAMVREAQAAAAARIEEKKRELSLSLEERRKRELEAIQKEVEELDREASNQAARIEIAASRSRDAAIVQIVNTVIA